MYNSDTELLFPSRLIPHLKNFRGAVWEDLIEEITKNDNTSNEYLAFVLLMVRLAGCVSCNPHSFRAIKGCTQCSRQTIRRFRGTDEELVQKFEQSLEEVTQHLENLQKDQVKKSKK